MTDRAAFLARVRERLTDGVPHNPLRPVADLGGRIPVIDYAVDVSDPVAAFTSAAAALGADVRPVDDALALVRDVCEEVGAQRVVVSRDPECDGVAAVLSGLGVAQVDATDAVAVAGADVGVTGAAYGIALTGSLVVDSRRAGSRTASLLPPVHLALLRAEAILPTPGDLFRDLTGRIPDGLPSNLVLITGPSRSADIELQLTVGVHGPKRLVIGLLDD